MCGKRTFPGHLAFVSGRDVVEPGRPIARFRNAVVELTVPLHTFPGRSEHPYRLAVALDGPKPRSLKRAERRVDTVARRSIIEELEMVDPWRKA